MSLYKFLKKMTTDCTCPKINIIKKKSLKSNTVAISCSKKMTQGSWIFFNKKTNAGLLFLRKVRSCVFISNYTGSETYITLYWIRNL